jgi:chromosome segregation ATPase
MSADDYAAHAQALLALSGDADARMRRQQASAQRAEQQGRAALEQQRRELTELRTRLDATLRRATQEQALARTPSPERVDIGADPLDLLRQLIERLDAAVADAGHARRALEAQRTREREQRRELESEARRRRDEAERQRREQVRRAQLVERGLLAGGAAATVGAVAALVAGLVVVAVVAFVLALAVLGATGWRRRAR